MVDPCVFRLMLNDAVVAMLVVHVDDIKIAATEEVTFCREKTSALSSLADSRGTVAMEDIGLGTVYRDYGQGVTFGALFFGALRGHSRE